LLLQASLVPVSLQTEGLCRFQEFPPDHVHSVRFVLGLVITLLGFTLGYFSDRTLLRLRRTGTYHIPRGGGFDMLAISCPHFLGEIIEWFGFCVACNFSVASLSFAVWSTANLVPRGLAQHEWYHQKFEEYPKDRKAILPLLL
jgi:3-oxo-5-alpha-steroid 4-dehydrogenase 1